MLKNTKKCKYASGAEIHIKLQNVGRNISISLNMQLLASATIFLPTPASF